MPIRKKIMSDRKIHPRDQSRLFGVKSPAHLASILSLPLSRLNLLAKSKNNYKRWLEKKTNRPIQEPKTELARLHRRVADLLSRIETPDFLYSAKKGCSYISNAEQHDPYEPTIKIDIRKFYPSARAQEVYHFFRDRMKCCGDVAGLLARLLTVDGHLATGSSVSPILSYFAYEEMFHEINKLAISRGCKMTCYVDDMVFTGANATRKLYYDLIPIVRRHHLRIHKVKRFQSGQPKVITGVAVTGSGSQLPHKQRRKMEEGRKALKIADTDKKKLDILKSLTGQMFAAAQIDKIWRPRALRMNEKLQDLKRKTETRADT